MSSVSGSGNQPHKPHIQSNENMSSEQAANYIWNDLLGELQEAYNDEIIKLQQEYANNPQAMQEKIKELGNKYQEQVSKISDAYNAARSVGVSQEGINKAIEDAKAAVAGMSGVEPTPQTQEAKEAKEIDQKANDMIQELSDQINEMIALQTKIEKDILSYEKKIEELQSQIAELEKEDPEKAKTALTKLEEAITNLNTLKNQSDSVKKEMVILSTLLTQIINKEGEINSLYDSILNGTDPAGNLAKLKEAFSSLETSKSSIEKIAGPLSEKLNEISKIAAALKSQLNSIDTGDSGKVDPKPIPDVKDWDPHGQEAYLDITLLPYWSMKDYNAIDPTTIQPEVFREYIMNQLASGVSIWSIKSDGIFADQDLVNQIAAELGITGGGPEFNKAIGDAFNSAVTNAKPFANGITPEAVLEKYLESLFDQMKAAGINQIDLAFSQLTGIDDLYAAINGDFDKLGSPCDMLAGIMRDHKVLNEDGTVTDALSKFIAIAHENGMKIDISFGGELGGEFAIAKEGETPAGQAQKLAEIMGVLGIDKVDFDLENALIVEQNSTEDLREFFTEVHTLLSAQGKESVITTMGSINDWVGNEANPGSGFFHDLFYDENGKPIFNDMFDGLNLMLYGQTTSYLDVGGGLGWGINDWLDIIGKDNASKIHIGFEDAVDYTNTSTNQGGKSGQPFDIREGSTSGEAAAQIFHQIKEWLKENGYSSDLGAPFWWPQYDTDQQTRYQINKEGEVDFMYGDEVDFWKELNKLENNQLKSSNQITNEDLIKKNRRGGMA